MNQTGTPPAGNNLLIVVRKRLRNIQFKINNKQFIIDKNKEDLFPILKVDEKSIENSSDLSPAPWNGDLAFWTISLLEDIPQDLESKSFYKESSTVWTISIFQFTNTSWKISRIDKMES